MTAAFTYYRMDQSDPHELQTCFHQQQLEERALMGRPLLDHLLVVEDRTFECDDDAIAFIEQKSHNTARQGLAWAVSYHAPMPSKRLQAAVIKLNQLIGHLQQAGVRREAIENKVVRQRQAVSALKRSLGARSPLVYWIIGGMPKSD